MGKEQQQPNLELVPEAHEMPKKSIETQLLDANVDDLEEISVASARAEEALTKNRDLLDESLQAVISGKELTPKNIEQLEKKIIGEQLDNMRRAADARENKEKAQKTNSALKTMATFGLGMITTGTIGEMLIKHDRRRGISGKSSLFGKETHADIRKAQKITRKAFLGLVFGAAGMGVGAGAGVLTAEITDRIIDRQDENFAEKARRAQEGEPPMTLQEQAKEYAGLVPDDFFEDPDNIEKITGVVVGIGSKMDNKVGQNLGAIGEVMKNNPEAAQVALRKALEATKTGKASVNLEDMLILRNATMNERKRRRKLKEEGIKLGDGDIEEMTVEELEGYEKDLANKTREKAGEVLKMQQEVDQLNNDLKNVDSNRQGVESSLREIEENLKSNAETIAALKKSSPVKGRLGNNELTQERTQLIQRKKELEQTQFGLDKQELSLLDRKNTVSNEHSIAREHMSLLYESRDTINSDMELIRSSQSEEGEEGGKVISLSDAMEARQSANGEEEAEQKEAA